ncbi:hypothetical protein EJ03DRAFT_328358 [Teratosphaeria nubilosa]|uniref:CBM1 domain-containing protein n=1 Tax=Teratosphaeria nubilosa TaxID=161662 RepID=A0A6G1L639_9PEZI|nr:hypothetical protein EJ03DRAFT_328358 [Teratosphaeria nubilosa]
MHPTTTTAAILSALALLLLPTPAAANDMTACTGQIYGIACTYMNGDEKVAGSCIGNPQRCRQ